MSRVLHFEVRGSAKSKGSLTFWGPGQVAEAVEGSKDWRDQVAWEAARAMVQTHWLRVVRPNPCRVDLVFDFEKRGRAEHPTTRSTYDADKLARNVLDALQDAKVIDDDSQVTHLTVVKRWGPEDTRPGVSVTITS